MVNNDHIKTKIEPNNNGTNEAKTEPIVNKLHKKSKNVQSDHISHNGENCHCEKKPLFVLLFKKSNTCFFSIGMGKKTTLQECLCYFSKKSNTSSGQYIAILSIFSSI